MTKFKVGDKVKYIGRRDNLDFGYEKGKTYTVSRIDSGVMSNGGAFCTKEQDNLQYGDLFIRESSCKSGYCIDGNKKDCPFKESIQESI
jgi:hypothetical protein